LPKLKKRAKAKDISPEASAQGVRPIWSGTITFGLVSIPVDLLSAVRPRQTSMKWIDAVGHALGRQYHCSKDGKKLDNDELVRGYETADGKMVVITDEEFESVAPEMSADVRLRNFVPINQIPPVYFQKPYILAPSGKSATAYNLLAATMKRTARAGIGSFVMRGHEYLVAIVSDNGVLRADTLRYADEIRSPGDIGLPARPKVSTKLVSQFTKVIEEMKRAELSMAELEDKESEELQALIKEKKKDRKSIIHQQNLEADEAEEPGKSAQIIDLTDLLRRSLSKRAVVTTAERSKPISLDERRALKGGAVGKTVAKKKGGTSQNKRATRP
jgi:DNA end-binding protein Ku